MMLFRGSMSRSNLLPCMMKKTLAIITTFTSLAVAVGRVLADPREVRPDLHELSPWSMFLSADALVKAVMISLALASLITWTVFFAKATLIRMSERQLQKSLADISAAKILPEAELGTEPKPNLLGSLLAAAREEIQMSGPGSNASRK